MTLWRFRAMREPDAAAVAMLRPFPRSHIADADAMWVAESVGDDTCRLLGAVRVRQEIGLQEPRYWYHLGCVVHAAPELGLFHRERTLLLASDLTGAAEIADVAVCADADIRVLRFLLRGALETLSSCNGVTRPGRVIVELPGLREADGRSPFWHHLGRHFYSGDPAQAEAHLGPAWRSHVAALLPRHPLHVSFLPEEARAAIGVVCPLASAWQQALDEAGCIAGEHVTVDEAGAVHEIDLPRWAVRHCWQRGDWPSATCLAANQALLIVAEGQSEVYRIPSASEEPVGQAKSAQLQGLPGGERVRWRLDD